MKYTLIGKTLAHSYSKIIHSSFGEYEYDLTELNENQLEAFVSGCPYGGFNVTIPYKKAIMPYLEGISPEAEKIGCVNTVLNKNGRLYGFNTDYDGFLALSQRAGIDFNGKKVAILGSGGTCLTATAVARDNGAGEIITVGRSSEFNYGNIEKWNDCEIIVNTTPVGMFPHNGERLISLTDFPKCCGVLDVIYNPHKTPLVFQAENLNIPASGGLYMLIYQAVRAYEIWLGKKMPREKIDEVYKKLCRTTHNIILIGMPGSGKSVLGKKIALQTGREFIDTDTEIEKEANMSIPEIFEKYGEEHFRKIEAQIALKCGSLSGKVIATGGGIVTREENLYSLKQNGIIYQVLRDISRLSREGRPLSKDNAALLKMERERMPLYNKFADKTIDNNGKIEYFEFKY